MKWLVVLALVGTSWWAEAGKNVGLKRWAAKKAELNEATAARICELKLMDIETLRQELIEAMGAADKLLLDPSFDKAQVARAAEDIRVMANVLIHRTNSGDRLGLEAFLFARDLDKDAADQNADATK